MKDIIDQEMKIGDIVVCQARAPYRGLRIGRITGITEKRVRVLYLKAGFDSLHHPNDICKIDSVDAIAYSLRHVTK